VSDAPLSIVLMGVLIIPSNDLLLLASSGVGRPILVCQGQNPSKWQARSDPVSARRLSMGPWIG